MKISVDLIKTLRGRTGAGIGSCKKALIEAEGDIEKAYDILRLKGEKNAESKSSRSASEGKVAVAIEQDAVAIVVVNCETDFVSKGDKFQKFADDLGQVALKSGASSVEALSQAAYGDSTVEAARVELVGWVGENVQITAVHYQKHEGSFVSIYQHGEKLACAVFTDVENDAVGKDVGMHIIANKPLSILPENFPSDILAREKELFLAETEQLGKPKEISEKIVQGKIQKLFKDNCLMEQMFVKDDSLSVKNYLAQANARVIDYIRVELGE